MTETEENTPRPERMPDAREPRSDTPRKTSPLEGRFPTVIDYFVFLGIFLLAQGIGLLAALAAGVPWPDFASLGSSDEAVSVAARTALGEFNAFTYFVSMSLTLGGFLLYRRWRHGPRIVARFSARGLDPVLLVWGVVFILVTSVVLEPLMSLLPAPPDAYGRGVWSLLTLVVMAPLFEEVLFRGVILESTRARYGVMAAWLVSSLIFGIIHLHPAIVLNAFVAGLILAFIYLKTDSLWPAIILHAINNGVAFVALISGHGNAMLSDLVGNRTYYVLIYLVALAVFLFSGYRVYRALGQIGAQEKNSSGA